MHLWQEQRKATDFTFNRADIWPADLQVTSLVPKGYKRQGIEKDRMVYCTSSEIWPQLAKDLLLGDLFPLFHMHTHEHTHTNVSGP